MHALETFVAHMTIAELAQRTGKTITQIAELAVNGKAKDFSLTPPIEVKTDDEAAPKKAKQKKAKQQARIDVRTPQGREEYREAVFAALTSEPVGAEELRAKVGGHAPQLRAALKALVADKRIASTGQARGTRYAVKTAKPSKAKAAKPKAAKPSKAAKKGKKKAPPRVTAAKAPGDTLDVRVLKYLRKRNAICTTEEIAEALEVNKGTVTKAIKGMEIDATIEPKERKDGTSGFVITEKGKTAY